MAMALADAIKGLDSVYQPQRDLIGQEQAAIDPSTQAAIGGLQQAKTNAFGDITSGANARGVLYSGVPINEQAKYVGTTFLPALAKIQQDSADRHFALTEALNKLGQDQQKQAQGEVDTQTAQEQAAAQAQAKLDQEQRQFEQNYALEKYKASNSAANRQPSAQERQLAVNQFLDQAFQGYSPTNKSHQFYTEKAVIPALQSQYGLNPTEAAKQAYAYRKTLFGE